MRLFFNTSNQSFLDDRDSFYQDKSRLIAEMNILLNDNLQKFMFVTRPHGFGKSMAVHLLNAYYSKGCDSKSYFENLEISYTKLIVQKNRRGIPEKKIFNNNITCDQYEIIDYTAYLNKYDVITIDCKTLTQYYKIFQETIQNIIKTTEPLYEIKNIITYLEYMIVSEIKEQYPQYINPQNTTDVVSALTELTQKAGNQFIILIDDWDLFFRDEPYAHDLELHQKYIQLLKDLFKDSTQFSLALAYITGILPIQSYYSTSIEGSFSHSSMLNPQNLAPYFGFTEKEVKSLAREYHKDYDELTQRYGKYTLGRHNIYNPKSLINALKSSSSFPCCMSSTSISKLVFNYMYRNFNNIQDDLVKMIVGREIFLPIRNFTNINNIRTKEQVLNLLINLGYLTCTMTKPASSNMFSIKIPNGEARRFLAAEIVRDQWKGSDEQIQLSESIFKATLERDEKKLVELLQQLNNEITLLFKLDHPLIAPLYDLIRAYQKEVIEFYNLSKEIFIGENYSNLILTPKKGIADLKLKPMIIGLMKAQSPEEVMLDLKKSNYLKLIKKEYPHRGIYLVGINYDNSLEKYQCKIEIKNAR